MLSCKLVLEELLLYLETMTFELLLNLLAESIGFFASEEDY